MIQFILNNMSKNLKNLSLTFGETASSPKVLTIASVNNLIKAIVDPDVTTNFSGHITSESGSINAAQAYSLSMAGITFHGNVTPIDFTFSLNKTSIVDGDEVNLLTSGVPTSVIEFTIETIIVDSGSITENEIRNICSFENNKFLVASAGIKTDWSASVSIKAKTKYTPTTEKTVTLTILHKTYNQLLVSNSSVNFDSFISKTVSLSFMPVDANVPIESIRATLENVSAIYNVGVSGNNILISCSSFDDLIYNKVLIETTDVAGKKLTGSIDISNKMSPTISIAGPDSFIAKNGIGTENYSFEFTKHNVDVNLISVTSSNSSVTVSNATKEGFKLNVSDSTETITTVITAIFDIDGVQKSIVKSIEITYKTVYNEFKVYANSSWVVPTSNLEVKVGDVVTEYIGDGIWRVDESLVDESMDVTAGGVVVGKYGKNEYSDGSEIIEFEIYCKNVNVDVSRFIGKDIIRIKPGDTGKRLTISNDDIATSGSAYSNLFDKVVWASTTLNDFKSISIKKQWLNSSSSGSSLYLYLPDELFNPFTPDLSLPSTSLIAKNGTLNELITPTTPNGGNIVLTGVNSSNTAITAAIEDNKIKLTGAIADGSPQTSTLTIYYTVNGYSRSVEVEVTATYQEIKDDNGHPYVDLGLPSGVLWATCNVGAENPEEYGKYFMWGEIEGNDCSDGTTKGRVYNQDTYDALGLNSISADLSIEQDAANVNMGGDWRIPTKEEFQELKNYTTITEITFNNKNVIKLQSTINNNYIILPKAGYCFNQELATIDSRCYYFSKTYNDTISSSYLTYQNSSMTISSGRRYNGMSLRAVL